jgi:methyl-accepting chemotaxis protein
VPEVKVGGRRVDLVWVTSDLVRGPRLTLITRIVLLGAVGVLSVGAVTVSATLASTSQGHAGQMMARISDGMSVQWNADMLHDGLRADVLGALHAGKAGWRSAR